MEKPTKVVVVGPYGQKLGRPVCTAVQASPNFNLVGVITKSVNDERRAGYIHDMSVHVSFLTLADMLQSVDCSALQDAVVFYAVKAGDLAPLLWSASRNGFRRHVVGTTGLDDADQSAIRGVAKLDAVVHASNFSVGANYWAEKCAEAARRFPAAAVEIIEMHHDQKADSPSGTAMLWARAIVAARGQNLDEVVIYGRKGKSKRQPGEICIHSVRGGSVTGFHRATFFFKHDEATIEHNARSSQLFADDALGVIRWSAGALVLSGQVYGMCDVFSLPLLKELGIR